MFIAFILMIGAIKLVDVLLVHLGLLQSGQGIFDFFNIYLGQLLTSDRILMIKDILADVYYFFPRDLILVAIGYATAFLVFRIILSIINLIWP